MTAPELKPCPFCGGEAVALTGPVKTLWGVTCLRCACWRDDRADTADEAVAAWNRRADLAAVQHAQVHNKIEAAAFSMWKAEADRAAPNVGKNRTPERFADASMAERDRWLYLAHAAMTVLEPQPDPRDTALEIWKLANSRDPDDPVFLAAIAGVNKPHIADYERKVAKMKEDFPNGI